MLFGDFFEDQGDDILIVGSAAYDEDFDALLAIRDYWAGTDDYATRVAKAASTWSSPGWTWMSSSTPRKGRRWSPSESTQKPGFWEQPGFSFSTQGVSGVGDPRQGQAFPRGCLLGRGQLRPQDERRAIIEE